MKSKICLLLCLLSAPLFAAPSYPPTFTDALAEADAFLVNLGWTKKI